MTDRSALSILLIQIRHKPQVAEEEKQSFIQFADITPDQLTVLNVFHTPTFSADVVEQYDAVFVGGASEASVLEPDRYPFVPYCVAALAHCYQIKKPVFASCFGFQLAVLALGGEIVRDQQDFETGTVPINLTDGAASDPLFANVPNPFYGVSVHRERAPALPTHCRLLAYTEQCPHAFKVEDAPFWAFQFHPEVDKQTLVERLTIYQDQYTEDPEHFKTIINEAQETPESNGLVKSFVDILTSK